MTTTTTAAPAATTEVPAQNATATAQAAGVGAAAALSANGGQAVPSFGAGKKTALFIAGVGVGVGGVYGVRALLDRLNNGN